MSLFLAIWKNPMGLFKDEDQIWSNIQILFNPIRPAGRRTDVMQAIKNVEQNKERGLENKWSFLFSALTQMGFLYGIKKIMFT